MGLQRGTDLTEATHSRLSRRVEYTALLVYVALLVWVIPHHESWGDEQLAWLLARSHSLWELATTILRNQGSPGLWYGTLWLIARLHLGFGMVHFLDGVLATCAVFVLLHFSPFPLWIRALLPFTFFLLFQYAVVARQYVFFPVLVFILAALLSSCQWRPYTFAAIGFLLANTSLHGWCFSVGITVAFVTLRQRLPLHQSFVVSRSNKGAALLLLAGWAIAAATAIPFGQSYGARGLKIAAKLAAPQAVDHASNLPARSPSAIQPASVLYVRPLGLNRLENRIWTASHRRSPSGESLRASRALRILILAASLVTFPIASSNLLAIFFLALIVIRLRRQRALVLLLPYLLIFAASLATQVYEHHSGLLFVSLIAALWISFRLVPPAPTLETRALLTTLFLVTLVQVYWGLHAVISEVRQPYTGDYAASRYLEPLYRGRRVLLGSGVMTSNPPIYSHSFGSRLSTLPLKSALEARPEIVLERETLTGDNNLWNQWMPMHRVGASEIELTETRQIQDAGYQETHRFCGSNFMRGGESRILCTVIYEPRTGLSPAR